MSSEEEEMKLQKAIIRRKVKAVLDLMTYEDRINGSQSVNGKLLNHTVYLASERVSIFLSTKTEISTVSILQDLFNRNKTVFVPRFHPGTNILDMVQLYSFDDFLSLPEIMWNIKQPPLDDHTRANALLSGLDLVITPGLAFTRHGRRLGYGRGYYDNFFLTYGKNHSGKQPYSIGLAFKQQILDDLPITDKDKIIDEIIIAD